MATINPDLPLPPRERERLLIRLGEEKDRAADLERRLERKESGREG
eukprot:gene8588-19343_t